MNIDIITVGKLKEKYFKDAVLEYSKRMSRFAKLNIIEVPDEKIPDNASEKVIEQIKDKEGEKIISSIKSGTVIAMCIEGTQITSPDLGNLIKNSSMTSSRITFIIGGSLGLSNNVKNIADHKISFGKITLPHQLMRVILLEQIYRGYKIINNENYHK